MRMSEEVSKEKPLKIDYTPPPKDWMEPSAEFRKGTYGYPGASKHEKYLELPKPREGQTTEKKWKLPQQQRNALIANHKLHLLPLDVRNAPLNWREHQHNR